MGLRDVNWGVCLRVVRLDVAGEEVQLRHAHGRLGLLDDLPERDLERDRLVRVHGLHDRVAEVAAEQFQHEFRAAVRGVVHLVLVDTREVVVLDRVDVVGLEAVRLVRDDRDQHLGAVSGEVPSRPCVPNSDAGTSQRNTPAVQTASFPFHLYLNCSFGSRVVYFTSSAGSCPCARVCSASASGRAATRATSRARTAKLCMTDDLQRGRQDRDGRDAGTGPLPTPGNTQTGCRAEAPIQQKVCAPCQFERWRKM